MQLCTITTRDLQLCVVLVSTWIREGRREYMLQHWRRTGPQRCGWHRHAGVHETGATVLDRTAADEGSREHDGRHTRRDGRQDSRRVARAKPKTGSRRMISALASDRPARGLSMLSVRNSAGASTTGDEGKGAAGNHERTLSAIACAGGLCRPACARTRGASIHFSQGPSNSLQAYLFVMTPRTSNRRRTAAGGHWPADRLTVTSRSGMPEQRDGKQSACAQHHRCACALANSHAIRHNRSALLRR